MGDPKHADAAEIPDFVGLDADVYAINKGYMHTPANYEVMTDNIMDLGHIEFLHEGLLGRAQGGDGERAVGDLDRLSEGERGVTDVRVGGRVDDDGREQRAVFERLDARA